MYLFSNVHITRRNDVEMVVKVETFTAEPPCGLPKTSGICRFS